MTKVNLTFKQEQSIDNIDFEEVLTFTTQGQKIFHGTDWSLNFTWINDEQDEVQIGIDYDSCDDIVTFHEVSSIQKLYLLLPLATYGEGYLKTLHGLMQWQTYLSKIDCDKSENWEKWTFFYTLSQQNSKIYQKLTLEMMTSI